MHPEPEPAGHAVPAADLAVTDVEELAVLDLRKLLDDPDAKAEFAEFARAERSEDSFLFWEEVNQFRDRWGGYGAGERADVARERDADDVISQYLNDGAPHQVCSGDARVTKLVDGDYVGSDMFDGLQQTIFDEMRLDALPRFARSAAGARLSQVAAFRVET